MNFTHFSRAMILPQGQFAAFLQASSDERSPILEQITGTGIYGEISMKVSELAGTHKRKLEELKQRADGIELFSEEQSNRGKRPFRTLNMSMIRVRRFCVR